MTPHTPFSPRLWHGLLTKVLITSGCARSGRVGHRSAAGRVAEFQPDPSVGFGAGVVEGADGEVLAGFARAKGQRAGGGHIVHACPGAVVARGVPDAHGARAAAPPRDRDG